jgi:hypothetical protein
VAELASSPDVFFDWHSSMIGKIMGHPTLGGVLKLVNPLLARMSKIPESAEVFASEATMAETGTSV